MLRSPAMYSRPPFIPTKPPPPPPPPQMSSPNDQSYGSDDGGRANCFSDSDQMVSSPDMSPYGQQKLPGSGMDNRQLPVSSPQGQETRQHLRDLLQRQQVKKLEQDQMSPTGMELHNVNVSPGGMWPQGTYDQS